MITIHWGNLAWLAVCLFATGIYFGMCFQLIWLHKGGHLK